MIDLSNFDFIEFVNSVPEGEYRVKEMRVAGSPYVPLLFTDDLSKLGNEIDYSKYAVRSRSQGSELLKAIMKSHPKLLFSEIMNIVNVLIDLRMVYREDDKFIWKHVSE